MTNRDSPDVASSVAVNSGFAAGVSAFTLSMPNPIIYADRAAVS